MYSYSGVWYCGSASFSFFCSGSSRSCSMRRFSRSSLQRMRSCFVLNFSAFLRIFSTFFVLTGEALDSESQAFSFSICLRSCSDSLL